jgi:hypothetical protein
MRIDPRRNGEAAFADRSGVRSDWSIPVELIGSTKWVPQTGWNQSTRRFDPSALGASGATRILFKR